MKKKKCSLCQKQKLNFTSPGSQNKAEVFMYGNHYLTFFGDGGADYIMECNYCPKCGRSLNF